MIRGDEDARQCGKNGTTEWVYALDFSSVNGFSSRVEEMQTEVVVLGFGFGAGGGL